MRRYLLLAFVFVASVCVRAEEFESATFEDDNFKVTWSKKWERLKPPNKLIHLALQKGGGNAILVAAFKANESLEAVTEQFDEEMKMRGERAAEVSRKPATVAGERGVTIKTEQPQGGGKLVMYVTLFTHQGIAYRIVGVSAADGEDFRLDYRNFLKRFSFIADRKEWLEQFVGKAGRTALLGGLASFELNRPRWTEKLPERRDYRKLEEAEFTFLSGGAWLNVTAHETSLDLNAELIELRQHLAQNFKKAEDTPVTGRVGGKEIPCIGFTTEHEEITRLLRGTVFLRDGVAIRVWLECVQSNTQETQSDWEQVLGGFVLHSPLNPPQPPAYAWKAGRQRDSETPSPQVDAIIAKAARISNRERISQLRAASHDGKRLLFAGTTGLEIEDLASGQREMLKVSAENGMSFCWSRDGRRIAWLDGSEITVVDVQPFKKQTLKIPAQRCEFSPDGEELYVVTTLGKPRTERYEVRSIEGERLERVKIADGSRRTVLEFALGSFTAPSFSPDGKQMAIWCNRDHPRTNRRAGGVYIADNDGQNLRPLIDEPHQISSFFWSADGKSLFLQGRRLQSWDDHTWGDDLHRVGAAGGAIENLTRCGTITSAAQLGGDILLGLNDYRLSDAKCGLFRISPGALTEAVAGLPEPVSADPEKSLERIASAVLSACGKKDLREVTPTPEIMEQAAEAFAQAAGPLSGPLDFSAATLDNLSKLLLHRDYTRREARAYIFGLSAYYGETLRRACGARWIIAKQRFGEWLPAAYEESNALVEAVQPFSTVFLTHTGNEYAYMKRSASLQNDQSGREIILVYPPTFAKEALKQATDDDYLAARKKLDSGDVASAVPLYLKVMQKHPRNKILAQEVIELCDVTGRDDMAHEITAKAVASGTEVEDFLVRHADALLKDKPDEALKHYLKAAHQPYPGAEVLLKLARLYAGKGQHAEAEACARKAHDHATPQQRKEIRVVLKVPEPAASGDEEELDLGE